MQLRALLGHVEIGHPGFRSVLQEHRMKAPKYVGPIQSVLKLKPIYLPPISPRRGGMT